LENAAKNETAGISKIQCPNRDAFTRFPIHYLFRHLYYRYVLYENNSKIAQKNNANKHNRKATITNKHFFVESYNIVATIQTTTRVMAAYKHWMLLLYFHPTRLKETDKHIT
jgi:hypothetical protein